MPRCVQDVQKVTFYIKYMIIELFKYRPLFLNTTLHIFIKTWTIIVRVLTNSWKEQFKVYLNYMPFSYEYKEWTILGNNIILSS